MSKTHQPYFAVNVISLLIILQACNSTPKIPVNSKFLGETISTTVDSEVARYYLESYLQGSRLNPDLDVRIGELYKQQKEAIPTREELKKKSDRFSVDFAALFLADRLWADENNRKIQNFFNHLLKDKKSIPNLLEYNALSCMLLFVPGWDYVENGHLTGADFAEPRKLVTGLGIENHLVEIPTTGSVEDIADYLTKELMVRSKSEKSIILVGASSAGPAIHLSLGEMINRHESKGVKAWVNLGGILQGSPLIDHYQKWPQRWLFNTVVWYQGWNKDKMLSMSAKQSRDRFERLNINKNILVINYMGLPLSGQLSKYSKDKYPLLASKGPNDGLTLLRDVIAPNSLTIIALGSDHLFAEDPKINDRTIALTILVISYLEEKKHSNINAIESARL
ncbi:hypothetical protein D1BOALGB6SA_2094 [Olavius sp. associated proteobacterium Delta 1]|nr:hypothetical protein D1BOALGB6SA_2094 [Olavius sp. associated proteobacterium Delta 1]